MLRAANHSVDGWQSREGEHMARRRSAARIGVTGLGQREELASGVFINTFYRGCTPGFIYTEDGIVLVDTPLIPTQAMDWRAQIEDEYPDTPFLCLINTDHHRGHALGNQYFLPVRVLAHERAYKTASSASRKSRRSSTTSSSCRPTSPLRSAPTCSTAGGASS
jgi:cyclase